ncbi:unnamed protein product, partial [Tetraodon nigroviridis]
GEGPVLCFSAVRRLCPPVPGQVGTHPLVGRRGGWSSCGVDALVPVGVAASLRRCFALIDSSALEQTRDETETDAQAHLDSLLELGLSSTVSTVLTQCSSDIYQVALQKVYGFATCSTFETCVSGRLVADVCRAAAKCHPAEALRLFVPHCCSVISRITHSQYCQRACTCSVCVCVE